VLFTCTTSVLDLFIIGEDHDEFGDAGKETEGSEKEEIYRSIIYQPGISACHINHSGVRFFKPH
jgi:hypothetical protein